MFNHVAWIGRRVALALALAAGCGDHATEATADGATGGGGGDEACGRDAMSSAPRPGASAITGRVQVTEPDRPAAMGDLYIAVIEASRFSTDSACNADAAPTEAVASTLVRCVDLGAGAFSYRVEGVSVNADEDYLVVAFLDVNGNVDPASPASAGPDACDLIALGVPVRVSEGDQTYAADDITLGAAGPLLVSLGCAACEG